MTEAVAVRSPTEETLVARRVLAGLDEIVERMGHAYCDEVREYASLGWDVIATEVLPVSRSVVEGFFVPISNSLEPDVGAIAELPEMGRRRLEMGLPLEPMLHVYRIAGRVVWSAVVEATRAGEETALATLGAKWMDYIDRASSVAAASYLDASHDRLRRVDAHRRALLDALLSASDAAELAAVSVQFSTVLAPSYVPVLIAGDEATARVDAVVAAAPAGSIGGFRSGAVLLLVPDQLDDIAPLSAAAGRCLTVCGNGAAPGPALAAEVVNVERLLLAARLTGDDTGAFGPDDLLLEQLVAASPRVAESLRSRVHDALAGRDHGGLLLSTLRNYLDTGSVPLTAEREHVHQNTVAYRIRRVRELTGLDARVPAESALLVLALAAGGRPTATKTP